jgi:hypothetical protein
VADSSGEVAERDLGIREPLHGDSLAGGDDRLENLDNVPEG